MGKKGRKSKKKKIGFHELKKTMEDIREKKGRIKIHISECPSRCPKIAEQSNCTFDTCIEIQKQVDADEEVLKAFDVATGKEEPVKKVDRGLKGSRYQQSRRFLRDEIRESKIRDGVRCYRLLEYDDDKNEIAPTCRTSIYGRVGKTDTLIVMIESHHVLLPHAHRHGKPLNIPMEDGMRRICLRGCNSCKERRKTVAARCEELGLKEKCEGCISRSEAVEDAGVWFKEYCYNIGIDYDYLPYNPIRKVARPMKKSKGEKWL